MTAIDKWMTINNYTAFFGGYLSESGDLFKRLCKNLLSLRLILFRDEPANRWSGSRSKPMNSWDRCLIRNSTSAYAVMDGVEALLPRGKIHHGAF